MARGQAGDKETEYIAQPKRSYSTKDTTCTNNPVFLLETPCAHGGGFLEEPEAGKLCCTPI